MVIKFHLGNKISEEDYATENLELLFTVSRQTSIALKNVILFAEINKKEKKNKN